MVRVEAYGVELVLQGSPYTLLAFREEFGEDLLEHLDRAMKGDHLPVEAYLRATWALCKTADDAVPEYAEWLRYFPSDRFSLSDARSLGVIDSAIHAELFRRIRTSPWKRLRRRISRWLERLAQRAGA